MNPSISDSKLEGILNSVWWYTCSEVTSSKDSQQMVLCTFLHKSVFLCLASESFLIILVYSCVLCIIRIMHIILSINVEPVVIVTVIGDIFQFFHIPQTRQH